MYISPLPLLKRAVMIDHLTSHNLYKVNLDSSSNSLQIIPSRVMTACISKSAANLFVWPRRFTHLNKASIKHLADLTSSIVVTSSPNTLPFSSVCVEAKMTRQPHREPRSHSTTAWFRLLDVEEINIPHFVFEERGVEGGHIGNQYPHNKC